MAFACFLVSAGRASAADLAFGDIIPFGDPPPATFGPNQSILIGGQLDYFGIGGGACSDPEGKGEAFGLIAADVYVISAGGPLGDGAQLNDVSGPLAHTVITSLSGGYFEDVEQIGVTAPTGRIGPGTYDVVFDECQDGKFNVGEDAQFMGAFTVEMPANVPPIDPAIHDLKIKAALQGAPWLAAEATLLAIDAYEKVKAVLDCIEAGPVGCGVDYVLGELKDWITEKLMNALGTEDPKDAMRRLIRSELQHWAAIAADPPDANFTVPSNLPPISTLVSQSSTPIAQAQFALANDSAVQGALTEAILHAIERFQGADQADNGDAALLHAREIQRYSTLLSQQLATTNADLASYAAAVAADPRDFDLYASRLAALRADVVDHGFTATQTQTLRNAGLSVADIADVRAQIIESDPAAGSKTVAAQRIAALQSTNTESIAALQSTAASIDPIVTQLLGDPSVFQVDPTVDAGGPYSVAEGSTIALAGSVVHLDPSHLVTSVDWDLDGDGQFDDAHFGDASGLTAGVSFPSAREGVIGLQVTDDSGRKGTAYAQLDVTQVNHGPSISAFVPDSSDASVRFGTLRAFSVTATDPDGDTLTYQWFVDGQPVGPGNSFTYAPTALADVGTHIVRVDVTDGRPDGGTVTQAWGVRVRAADVDADGWDANVDCDDTRAAVNPGASEVRGNGRDDDCNPSTTDDSNAPFASFTGPATLATGAAASFHDTSTAGYVVVSRDWDFGDGATGTGTDATHAFAAAGTYTVKLKVSDDHGFSDTASQIVTVTDGPAPVAAFSPRGDGGVVSFVERGATVVSSTPSYGGHDVQNMLHPTRPGLPWAPFYNGGDLTAVIRLAPGGPWPLSAFRLMPRPDYADQRVKTFTIETSLDGVTWAVALSGTTTNDDTLQEFQLSHAVSAQYLRYRPLTSWGGGSSCGGCISTSQLQAFTGSEGGRTFAFENQSQNATDVEWSFGDGGTSTETSPTHTYTAVGFYTVTLTAKDAIGRMSTAQSVVHVVALGPTAAFTPTASPAAGIPVSFTDGSFPNGSTLASWSWNFDDGGTSSFRNPVHTYSTPGTYTVKLVVRDANGLTDTVTHEVNVAADSAVQAFFSPAAGDPVNVASSLGGATIAAASGYCCGGWEPQNLLDGSAGSAWASNGPGPAWVKIALARGQEWLIGRFRIRPRPDYQPQRPTQFEVAVSTTTTDDAAFSTVLQETLADNGDLQEFSLDRPVRAKYVRYRVLGNRGDGCCATTSDFEALSGQASQPLVAFTSLSRNADGVSWDFGDGSLASVLPNPTHLYATPGTYHVTLTATHGAETDSITLDQVVGGTPSASFTEAPSPSAEAQSVTFASTSTTPNGGDPRASWSFGDGGSAVGRSVGHQYFTSGTRSVTLTITDWLGYTNAVTRSHVVTNVAPTATVGTDGLYHPGASWLVAKGSQLSFGANVSDPGNDIIGCTWDFGDGTSVDSCSFGHAYSATGDYTATLTVRDAAGEEGTASTIVRVFQPTSSISFTQISTSFNSPIGIDYHQPTNSVIISANYNGGGQPYNFERINFDGTHTPFSSINGLTDEIKIATVRQSSCQGGFDVGELFVGTGVPGDVARISADGSSIQRPWVHLPGEFGLMRGSLFQDQFCAFGGDVIVVTTNGGVWRISSAGVSAKLAQINTHLEGLTTLPNDPGRYGPWAGKILVGAEGQGLIYSVSPTGEVRSWNLGIAPEDIDVVPANENFFGVNFSSNRILGAPESMFTDKVGDILFAQESAGATFSVHWNGSTQTYEPSRIAPDVGQWEHVTFAGAGISEIPPANGAPVAAAEHLTTDDSTPVSITLSATDPENDPLTYTVLSSPTGGSLSGTPPNLTYTPRPGAGGTDTFTFKARDGANDSNIATVTISVTRINSPPVGAPDEYSVHFGRTLHVAAPGVLGNDTDADGNPLTASSMPLHAQHGQAALASTGELIYTPAPGFVGDDTFTYTPHDSTVDGAPVTVTIHVTDTAPIPALDGYTTLQDQTLTISNPGVLANDTDPDGDPLTRSMLVDQATHGQVLLAFAGGFIYVPAPGFHGTDSFTYTVGDGARESAPATVTIAVDGAPVASDDEFSTHHGTALDIPYSALTANDSDPEGEPLFVVTSSAAGAAHGTIAVGATGFTYTPDRGFHGDDTFTYRNTDGLAQSPPATVTVHVTDTAPLAGDDAYSVHAGQVLHVAVPGPLANDSDPDGDPVTVVSGTQPAHGTYLLSAEGDLTYTPAAGFAGTDSLTYAVTDGALSSASATITFHVTNSVPVGAPESYSVHFGQTLHVDAPGVLGNDTDPEGDPLTASSMPQHPQHGQAALATTGELFYTPAAGFVGDDSFTYTPNDGFADGAPVTVTIHVTDGAPVALLDSAAVLQGDAVSGNVLANDSDPDGDPLSVALFSGPAHGTVSLAPDGSFTFTSAPDTFGVETFTYLLSDGGISVPGTVTVDVRPRNRPPVVALAPAGPVDEGASIPLTASGSDPDTGQTLTYAWSVTPNATLVATGATASFFADDGPATAVVTVRACDDGAPAQCAEASRSIEVRNVAPSVTVQAAPSPQFWGLPVHFTGAATDPSAADTSHGFAYAWGLGDSAVASSRELDHGYGLPGSYTATFSATDKDAGTGSGTVAVTITKRPTAIAFVAPLTQPFGPSQLVARIADTTDPATAQLAGRVVIFATGGRTFTATTDATGTASVTPPPFLLSGAVSLSVPANARYLAAATAVQLEITNPFGGGSGFFAIGDRTSAGGTVTWWGSQWEKSNLLSGGAAPSAFKGFVDALTVPGCGGTWTTRPGNSSGPPSSVGPYLAVIVAGRITKSGSTISGTSLHIVAVKTAAGYGPAPGREGTGQVVGTVC